MRSNSFHARWGRLAGLSLLAGLSAPLCAAPPLHPSDPAAATPPMLAASALQSYRPLGETELADWRASNRRVQEVGGWRAYAREAARAAKPEADSGAGAGQKTAPATPHHH